MLANETADVRTAHFLLTLEQELHIDRKLSQTFQNRLRAFHLGIHLSLVIAATAPIDLAVADYRFEWR